MHIHIFNKSDGALKLCFFLGVIEISSISFVFFFNKNTIAFRKTNIKVKIKKDNSHVTSIFVFKDNFFLLFSVLIK